MPSSYASFQGKEPNIDVNLFVNALTQGIAAGNAQDTTFSAIAKGIQGGVKSGINTYQGIQDIQAKNIELERESDPAVQQARKDKIIADAEKAQREAKEATDALEAEKKRKQAQVIIAKADQEMGDIKVKDELDDALNNPYTLPQDLANIFKKASGVASRDNEFIVQALERAKGRLDPVTWDGFKSSYDALEIAKTRAQLAESKDRALQTEALRKKDKIEDATATLASVSPRLKAKMADKATYDPTKLDVVPSNSVERDKTTGKVKFDAEGRPLISNKPGELDDKNFLMTYNGEELEVLDPERGKDASKSMEFYRLGTSAIMKDKSSLTQTKPEEPAPPSFENRGLAAEQARIDQQLEQFTGPATPKAVPTVPPEVLKGKTPEQQNAIQERFDQRIAQLENVPREVRPIVQRVNSHPLLRNASPLVKSIASWESQGNNDAVSPTKVKGLMQVTGDTYRGIRNKYANVFNKLNLTEDSAEAELLSSKLLLIDLYNQFSDTAIVLAAYNAGAPALAKAVAATKGSKPTWEQVKPNLKPYVSAEKFKEVENYPEKVLKFMPYYNG